MARNEYRELGTNHIEREREREREERVALSKLRTWVRSNFVVNFQKLKQVILSRTRKAYF
jgi:hypothetical protein